MGPSICVNPHETGQAGVKETEGRIFRVENMEEAVHIKIEGTAVVDGYADPYETASFIGDFWLDRKSS